MDETIYLCVWGNIIAQYTGNSKAIGLHLNPKPEKIDPFGYSRKVRARIFYLVALNEH